MPPRRMSQLHSRLEMLRRLQSAAEGVDAGVRCLSWATATIPGSPAHDAVEGLVGLVRDMVRVPPGLERAIEAALAENVQALVFENINYRPRRHRGPARAARPAAPSSTRSTVMRAIRRSTSCAKTASSAWPRRWCAVENRFRTLVDTLLGRTIVVETFAAGAVGAAAGHGLRGHAGRRAAASERRHRRRLTRAAAEAFTRQRELDELPAEIATLEIAQARRRDAAYVREKDSITGAKHGAGPLEPRLESLREERAAARRPCSKTAAV